LWCFSGSELELDELELDELLLELEEDDPERFLPWCSPSDSDEELDDELGLS